MSPPNLARRALSLIAALGALMLLPAVARGQSCSLTITGMNFGAADLLSGSPTDTTATGQFSCSGMPSGPTTCYCVGFGPGSGGSSGSSRLMTGPSGSTLKYTFYADSGHSAPWGSTSFSALGSPYGTCSTSSTPSSAPTPIYGRVTGGQSSAVPGSYSSTFSGAVNAQLYTLASGGTNCATGTAASSPTATTSFTVSASPTSNCIVSASAIAFGPTGVLGANTDATGTVTVTCTSTTPYTVGLGNGLTGAGPTARLMKNGSNAITYGLYRDSARSLAWGSTVGTNTAAGTGTGVAQAITVYGRVPPQTTPVAGSYTDTVAITVGY